MEYKDYYKILGVERDASQDQIKQSYRKLARKYHPDINKEASAENTFKDIGEAYEVLKDPEKRAAYDQFGANWQEGQNFDPPPNWDAGFEFRGAGYTGADASEFSDFFESLFGRTQQSGPRQYTFRMQGEDQHAKILISLQDAYAGGQRTITLNRQVINQQGQIQMQPHTLNLTIPKGILEGQRIRLEGQGMPGHGGAPAGDLYLEIAFEEDRIFHAEKRDVHLSLPVTPWEAALGASVTVPTLGGKVQLKIPAGSQGGNKLRLKGRGLSTPTQSGDQIVTLRIVVPEAKTEEQRALYEEMAKKLPTHPRTELGV
ncbi:DnaJ domain-containing protein [Desulfobulbus rhabdoformis]|uniref:DnaJ C-terminal domain-containing protein n=1 Tax=Desulfobulbus rhabdoformis TaxID=34032 RepID=UPI0019630F01|nr:DnaJ C-terminal domain-containing protein [Desulfobulbus rhabdoformis]MBM9614302.1 DnaJ domain-containing protein [Desulfobulbus rhabdoformis]